MVRAKRFYGYHSSEELFVKIYLYYPQDISRLANLLLGGAIFEKIIQPYESHIPFLLQFMVDYNLYGMGHVHLLKMKFRHPVPDDVVSETADHFGPEAADIQPFDSQADAVNSSCSSSLVWSVSTIPDDWMWPYSVEPSAPSNRMTYTVKRQSSCQLEGDAIVDDILNQQCKTYTSLSQLHSDVRMVQSLIPIWEEEIQRSGMHETEMLADPGKPLAQSVIRTFSAGVDYVSKLTELYSKAESTLSATSEEDVGRVVPAHCSTEERSLVGTGTQNSEEQALMSAEALKMSIQSQNSEGSDAVAALRSQVTEGLDSKAADPEDVALLKWLASSQAAEEINSDDELRRDTILNPLLPAASINKVLEKANTDYETETLQECQDILDSLEDVLTPDDQEEKAPSTAHDKVPQALSAKTIPQLDGAGDDHLLTTTANTSDVVVDSKSVSPNRETFPPCNTGLSNEHIRQKLQWGYLPLSPVRKRNEDIHSGTCSVNMSIKSSGQDINDSLIHSSVKCGSNICNDLPSKSADVGGSNSIESRTLLGCSVRDLMRKKRCFRAGLSEHTRSERVNLRRKLEFHAEQSKDDIMPPFEASASGHIQMSEAMELCENILSPPLLSGGTRKQDCTNLPATCNDKELQFGVFASKNLESSLDMTCQNTNNENENFIYGDLRQSIASCSNCCTGQGKMFLEDCRPGEFRRAGTVEQYPSLYMDLESGYGFKEEKGPSGYVRMSFYKKPPVSWKSGTSENLHFKDPSLESISESDDEEITDKSEGLENVLPFFTESNEGLPIKSYSSNDFYRESCLGVPTYYQNDGSFAYLLTPAISPPSVYSVLEWLGVKERANLLQRSIPEPTLGFGLQPRENQVDQESHKNVKIGGGSVSYELQRHQEQSYPMKAKEDSMASQDISQISGPTRHSKPTPLSQMGFRDPASVGAGQQLTIISIEVQAESRGDLRPDPQHDAINIIVLSIQNDNCTSVDTHVLLRGAMETCGRNFDGITTGKLFVCSEEIGLLDLFVNKVRSIDPDILMGWDIQGSSLGFLAERAAHLGVSLLNKISRTPSETKTEKKEPVPAGKGNSDADSCDSIISDTVIHDNAIIEDEWGRTHASGVHVGGRIVLNVWRLVRGEVKLNMYTLEAVAEAVLRRKVPSIPWKILNEWFLSGPQRARFRCIDYLVERAKLNLDILDQLDMVNRTSELARIFGIDFFSVLSRGSQYRVESMLVRLAHTQNYVLISPGYQQVASQPAMECLPLVMEPESGFYPDPVIVLDFQSLYPSMIIAYNLCFCTCLGNVAPSKADTLGVSSYSPNMHILKDLHQQILVTPNGVMYVPSKARKGVLPRLLEEILSTRIMVKKAMKKLEPSQKILHRIFNARQLALKLIANVTYGYTAAGFSGRMPCAELADSIVQCGRRTLEQAISVVNAHDQWNARVVYGDTDSMFVLVKGRTVKEAFQIGKEIASTITALNPNPVTLKMEKVYQSCFLLTKKRYVGYSYESPDQPKPTFDAKGIETVRRDTCGAVAKILEKSLRLFFKHQDISKVRVYLERQWSRILSKRVSLQDFVFAKEVRLGTYSMRASSSLPPAAIVASKAMRADPRAEPRYAERVPYVVVHGEPGARLIDMVVDPHELLAIDSPYRLNDVYYITKQIIPALQRVFGLVGADLSQWFQEMPRPSRDAPTKHHFNAVNSVRARIDHYYSSRHCVLCRELTQGPNHLCEKCSKKGPVAAAAMTGITSRLERDIQHLVTICRHCGGGDWLIESGVKCTSLACPMYYERRKVQKELRAFSSIATDASFYPKCVVEWF